MNPESECAYSALLFPILSVIKRDLDIAGALRFGRKFYVDVSLAEKVDLISARYMAPRPQYCFDIELVYPPNHSGLSTSKVVSSNLERATESIYEYSNPSELEEEMRRENEDLPPVQLKHGDIVRTSGHWSAVDSGKTEYSVDNFYCDKAR